jgi:hypothetical protein
MECECRLRRGIVDKEDENVDHHVGRVLFEHLLAFDDECREYRREDGGLESRQ